MSERWPVKLRFGGLGGQGLVTMGAVLADAGARAGLQVAASQSYGSRARGGATRSDVILSNELVDFPHVHHPDLLVVLAQEAWDLYLPDMKQGSTILYDRFFVSETAVDGISLLGFDGTETALREVGNKVSANFVMFGAVMGLTGLVAAEHLQAAMESLVNPRFLSVNSKAFELGWGLGQEARTGGV